MNDAALLRKRLDMLATDIGRLRRCCDQLTRHVESLTAQLEPTAAELAAWTAPGDDQAVTEAIRIVDERSNKLRRQLGAEA